ncbi:hypothetical protein H0H81_007646 [Sphagnurus paluster]|uniref:Arrestin C-terminal-like domain-containing protein n=1 Tax=Sphagnurus paluster TaxID=117069 RepID=A0A9P7FZ65_9AGAR|nr:hypothetical protein H0H81_007646 [Sphagnurus paluster]
MHLMAFVLSRTSSTGHPREAPQIGVDSAPLPHASTSTGISHLDHHDMTKEKEHKPRVEILLDSPYLFLKGVGVDVEPTRLSGHVALYLNEATPIKEITLQFRGKARLPIPTSEAYVPYLLRCVDLWLTRVPFRISINPAPLSYIVCTYDWSFLEGKSTSHTLKAGRHLFPFQLRIGGSLPSTISSPAFGGAAVSYKLRAHVVRSGFAFNQTYHAGLPIHIIRSFAPEAMEYQQSLEIENTWPEKLMYSVMVPHKAWAAGDKLTGLVKFSPISKGVCVLEVTTSIYEQTKVYARSGTQEQSRLVATTKHEIINGRAVEVENRRPEHRRSHSSAQTRPPSPLSPASPPPGFANVNPPRASSSSSLSSLGRQSFSANTPVHASAPSTPRRPSTEAPVASSSAGSSGGPFVAEPDVEITENADVETYLSIYVPLTVTPSHSLEPIIVTHRIRWSILILNLDGHTSELRCSLPLHILDYRLLNESRVHSAATRRLLIGEAEVPPVEEEDVQLPSYNQHIRDRVANMFLPDSATLRVTNPWIWQGASPVHAPDAPPTAWPITSSGQSTPLEAHLLTHLPHQPDPTSSTPLEWVNSELLLSLSDHAPPRLRAHSPTRPADSPPSSGPISRTHSRTNSRSRPDSRGLSRFSSRATSVERDRQHPIAQIHVGGAHETYVHSGHASRNMHSLFAATMKPFSSFSPYWMSRTSSALPSPAEMEREREVATRPNQVHTISVPDRVTGTELLHRAFTEVPDYAVASRGFIGGVPPLSSMQGLPSYEETVRTSSDGDLSARFSALSVDDRTRAASSPAPRSASPIT